MDQPVTFLDLLTVMLAAYVSFGIVWSVDKLWTKRTGTSPAARLVGRLLDQPERKNPVPPIPAARRLKLEQLEAGSEALSVALDKYQEQMALLRLEAAATVDHARQNGQAEKVSA